MVDSAEFRAAMSRFPTGVTVVTSSTPAGPAGATANAVASLSLEPPLILACLDRGSRTLRTLREHGRFGVNVLAAEQSELARRFASKAGSAEKWSGVRWEDRHGVPAIGGAAIFVACGVERLHDGGDHEIVTGTVFEATASPEAEPLVFFDGAYRAL